MKIDKILLVKSIAFSLLVGVVAALLTSGSMKTFETLNKPPLSPSGWLFPVVWTILYTLMGIAFYLILTDDAEKQEKSKALNVYIYQLVVNFLWPIPYLIWVTFAGYLNLGIWLLN